MKSDTTLLRKSLMLILGITAGFFLCLISQFILDKNLNISEADIANPKTAEVEVLTESVMKIVKTMLGSKYFSEYDFISLRNLTIKNNFLDDHARESIIRSTSRHTNNAKWLVDELYTQNIKSYLLDLHQLNNVLFREEESIIIDNRLNRHESDKTKVSSISISKPVIGNGFFIVVISESSAHRAGISCLLFKIDKESCELIDENILGIYWSILQKPVVPKPQEVLA